MLTFDRAARRVSALAAFVRSIDFERLTWRIVSLVSRSGVVVALLYFCHKFLVTACSRMGYPYELEWMEGGMLTQVQRFVAGLPLYTAPSLDYTAFIYPPGYFALGSLFYRVFGGGFFSLRLLSFLSTLGSMACIARLVWREHHDRWATCVAVGFFAATFRICGFWFDLARVDTLFLCLLLLSIDTLRGSTSARGDALAAAFGCAAFLVKQSTLLALFPVALYTLGAEKGLRRVVFSTTLGLLALGSALILFWTTRGWYGFYVFALPSRHPLDPAQYLDFWKRDLFGLVPVACLLTCGYCLWRLARKPKQGLFWSAVCSGMLATAWFSRLHEGGYLNVLLPGYCVLSLGAGLGAAALGHSALPNQRHALQTFASMGLLLQLALLDYDATFQQPTVQERSAADALVGDLERLTGRALVPIAPYLLTMAGKPTHAHEVALTDVLRTDLPQADTLRAQISQAFDDKQFVLLLLSDSWFRPEIDRNYYLYGKLRDDRTFVARAGAWRRINEVMMPQPQAQATAQR